MDIAIRCCRCDSTFTCNTGHYRFLKVKHVPNKCPRCKDAEQGGPAKHLVTSREVLQEYDAVKISVPVERFKLYQGVGPAEQNASRAVFTGADGGDAAWHGRMDVWDARQNRSALGRIRVMRVTHETAEEGFSPDYRYVAIDQSDATEARSAFIYGVVHWKTTVKGLGRQVYAEIDSCAIWEYRMRSWSRTTGRIGCFSILAMVDDRHTVVLKNSGDEILKKEFSATHPLGLDLLTGRSP